MESLKIHDLDYSIITNRSKQANSILKFQILQLISLYFYSLKSREN